MKCLNIMEVIMEKIIKEVLLYTIIICKLQLHSDYKLTFYNYKLYKVIKLNKF